MDKSTFSPLYEDFRRRLVAMRHQAGLTQRQLAARLERERSFVTRIEQGERRLDVVEFYWLCRALGIDPKSMAEAVMAELARVDRRRTGRRRLTPRP